MFVIVRTGHGAGTKSAPRRSGLARPLIVCALLCAREGGVRRRMGAICAWWVAAVWCCKYICRVSSSFRDSKAAHVQISTCSAKSTRRERKRHFPPSGSARTALHCPTKEAAFANQVSSESLLDLARRCL